MATLTLDEVDPALVRRLHDRAAAEGVSAEELHRRILARALGEPRAAIMAQAFRRLGELGFETTASAPGRSGPTPARSSERVRRRHEHCLGAHQGRQGRAGTDWIDRTEPRSLYLAATTIYEITLRPRAAAAGPQARPARSRLGARGDGRPFEDRILPLDEAAQRDGDGSWRGGENLWASRRRSSTPRSPRSPWSNGMTVVTRDRRGFGRLGCDLLVLD